MKISEVNDSLENIDLPATQKKGILQVIDAKISNDMKEVIGEIRQLEGKIVILEDKVQMVHDKIQLVHDKLSNEIKTMYWVIGIAMTIMLFLVARK
ncbi:MAG TPA: hypothetical protein VGS79_25510 [Puia sp.]|nr:hypothetical protein [Puia sp.]